MPFARLIFSLLLLALFAGCTHNVKVQPIHIVVDVNVRVEKALDEYFAELDAKDPTLNPKSSAP